MIAVQRQQHSSRHMLKSTSWNNDLRNLQRLSSKLYHRYQSLQVSYRGSKYSVERMLALDEYIQKVSPLRVAVVVSGALVPMVLLVVSQESLPLNDPKAGWKVNYGFWLRVGILSGVVGCTAAIQAKHIVPHATLTNRQLALLFFCLLLSYPVVSMGIAAIVGFPIPFFALSTIPLFAVLVVAWFALIAGKKAVENMLKSRKELVTFGKYLCAQMLMPVVYPVYEVVFYAASNIYYELAVVLMLPIIKIVMKYIVTLALNRNEDMLPSAVIFTVEFFHAVYLATCMQRTRSIVTVTLIILVDVTQSVLMLYGLHCRSRATLLRLNRAAGLTSSKESMIGLLRLICTKQSRIEKQSLVGVQISSCLVHKLSPANNLLLSSMKKLQQERKNRRASFRSNKSGNGASFTQVIPSKKRTCISRLWSILQQRHCRAVIVPSSIVPMSQIVHATQKSSRHNSLGYRPSNIFQEGLEALFTSECLVLVSYLHSSIAMFYANFIVVMVYLPSARYHTELHGVTRANVADTVKSVFVFGMLEFVSLGLLTVMLKRKYGMAAFYHLAFVLETQAELIQGKVMMWMLVILAFRVVHFGVDFTLQFSWIRGSDV